MIKKKRLSGSITVEAAIVLPIFICVVISMAMCIKLIYIHDVMQHAIDEAVNELAAYSYIYHVSDLQEIDNSVQDTIEDNAAQGSKHTETFFDAYETMEKTVQAGNDAVVDIKEISSSQGNFDNKAEEILEQASEIKSTGEQLTKENMQSIKALEQVFNEAGKDPRKEAESMAWMLSNGIYSDAKTIIAVPIIKQTIKKYLIQDGYNDVDMILKKLNISGGFNGLDFYSSTFFKNNQDIDIIVKYKVELALPIKLLPDIYIVQRSTARAWLEGGDGTALDEMDIWALPNKKRGMKIEEMNGGNLPFGFPVIDIYDEKTKTGTSIKSTNLNSKTYKDSTTLKKKLESYVDALKDRDSISYEGKNYSLLNKKIILVIPKESTNEDNKAVIDQIISYAKENGIQITISEL